MARDAQDTGLVILAYNPATSTRDRNLVRSTALSHAARVSHARRRRTRRPRPEQQDDETTPRDECTLQQSSLYPVRYRTGLTLPLGLGSLQQGNHDPFDSTAVRVAPDTAHLMSTWKKYLEINPNDSTRWLSIADMERDFSLARESELNSKSLVFAASAALSARFPHHHGLRAMASQSRRICLSHLNSIARSQIGLPATTELANCLLLVFIGLCLFDELTEAREYARQLRKLLKHPNLWEMPALIAIWSRLYYDDILFATRYFRPPLLDSSPFVERWSPVLKDLRLWETSRLPIPCKVTAPAFSKTIEGLFSSLQRQIDIQSRNTLYTSERFDENHMTGSLAVILEITYSLFDHWQYIEAVVQRKREGLDRVKWHNEAKVTLCALAFLANMIAGPKTPDGPDFRECGWRAMQTLRHHLEQVSMLASSHPDFLTYQYLQVWAYYLGAIWECECNLSDLETWYTAQLRLKVQELGIRSWNALKSIVDRFLRVPAMYKPGTVWFLGMSRMIPVADSSGSHQEPSSSARLADITFA